MSRLGDGCVKLAGEREYLRAHDRIGGYMPLLAMDAEASAAWTSLWAEIRRLDEHSEDDRATERGEVVQPIFTWSHPEVAAELRGLAEWPRKENLIYNGKGLRSISDYFELMYYRAYCPVFLCGFISLTGEPRSALETFAMYVGYGAQLMDDTLDFFEDLARGRVYVTREELDALGIPLSDLPAPDNLRLLTRLRNKWALYYYLRAYRVTQLFRPANARLARFWLEFGLRALLDGRIHPLPIEIARDHRAYCRHFGSYSDLFDLPFPIESLRYLLTRSIVRRLVHTIRIVEIEDAQAMYDGEPLEIPAGFRVESLHGRCWSPLRLPRSVRDDRRPLRLVYYGGNGVLPTLFDLARAVMPRFLTQHTSASTGRGSTPRGRTSSRSIPS